MMKVFCFAASGGSSRESAVLTKQLSRFMKAHRYRWNRYCCASGKRTESKSIIDIAVLLERKKNSNIRITKRIWKADINHGRRREL
jgi:phosphotransferase system HPr-like phosphotransfer protein